MSPTVKRSSTGLAIALAKYSRPNPYASTLSEFPSQFRVPIFFRCFHHLPNFPPIFYNGFSNYQCFNKSLLWYSSKSDRPWSRAYRKRANKRLRLANKPVLDEPRFRNAVSKLPARFTACDLLNAIAVEDDPLVCLELFTWASERPRFTHTVDTFHITIQKLGVAGMMDEMFEVVDRLLAVPQFGCEPLYNTIIYYFARARKLTRAVTVFKHMKKLEKPDCKPSLKTYNLLFAAFVSRGKDTYMNHVFMGTMECLFRQLLSDGIEPDVFTLNSMIQGYVLSNHVNDALRMFHQVGVVYSSRPDAVTYDQLIHGLCAQGRTNNAKELLSDMKGKGFIGSAKTYNSLVNALALAGELEEALKLLWEMTDKKISADYITYKTLLYEFCQKGRAAVALSLLEEFKTKSFIGGPMCSKLSHVIKDDSANGRRTSVESRRALMFSQV